MFFHTMGTSIACLTKRGRETVFSHENEAHLRLNSVCWFRAEGTPYSTCVASKAKREAPFIFRERRECHKSIQEYLQVVASPFAGSKIKAQSRVTPSCLKVCSQLSVRQQRFMFLSAKRFVFKERLSPGHEEEQYLLHPKSFKPDCEHIDHTPLLCRFRDSIPRNHKHLLVFRSTRTPF